jgi:alkylated DNA repair dioxygenase AlkB
LALMTGESRSLWTHEIMKRQNDYVGGLKVPRGRRLSITFRTVNQND